MPPATLGTAQEVKYMDVSAYLAAAIAAIVTLLIRFIISRSTHSGSVRSSDAETVFQASEAVRNDLATELVACRKDRDHYAKQLADCLEVKHVR
jgi:hypothetical protein